MTLEELNTHIKSILDRTIEGEVPENLEDVFEEIRRDYSSRETGEEETEENREWKEKYIALKEKYINRFLTGREEGREGKKEEIKEREEPEKKEYDEVEIKDIWEEEK